MVFFVKSEIREKHKQNGPRPKFCILIILKSFLNKFIKYRFCKS